jgi:hypothetical protein
LKEKNKRLFGKVHKHVRHTTLDHAQRFVRLNFDDEAVL